MHYEQALAKQLRRGSKRWLHSLGTRQEAGLLAVRWGYDPEIAQTAGLLHDITKSWTLARHLNFCEKCDMMSVSFENGKNTADAGYDSPVHEKLLHAVTGALWAERECGVSGEVADAIRWHTTGRDGMSLLEKIIFLADKIEPARRYPHVMALRRLSYENIDAAMRMALDMSLYKLLGGGQFISPATILARNAFL